MNRTTLFLIPLVLDYVYIYYIEGYLGLNYLEDINGVIYLTPKTLIPEKLKTNIEENENFKGKTIINKKTFYIFQIPEIYIKDYEQFVIGNYRKMKYETRRLIYQFWHNTDLDSIKNIVLNTLFENEKINDLIAEDLSKNNFDKKEIKKIINKMNEVNSIPKIEEEIYYTNT